MKTTEEITLAQFIAQNRLKLDCEQTDSNPNIDDGKYPMDHWDCVIHKITGNRKVSLLFSMGHGHGGRAPRLDEVLDCLASDSSGTEQHFEDWCSDLGYDTDSRKAERTYEVCQKQAAKLKALLGDEAYDQLLYHTERL